jgi:hypothetical protein
MQPRSIAFTAAAAAPAQAAARTRLRKGLFGEMGWMEVFIFCQFLLPGILFLPGAQSIRTVLRTIPYLSCALLVPVYHSRVKKIRLAPGCRLVLMALMLLVVELLHPESGFTTGLAQCVFQLCIALPLYWGAGMVENAARLRRLLWLVLLANGFSAGLGFLQALEPETFLPREFAQSVVRNNPNYVESLSYVGASGQKIVRPPGLNDTAGSAALAGLFAAIIGLGLAAEPSLKRWKRILALACVFAGITDIYLAQVRSLFLVLVVAVAALAFIRHYRASLFSRRWISLVGLGMIGASFLIAVSIGGEAVSGRFLGIGEQGVYSSYEQNRGIFVNYTLRELLWQYPLGAGVGRWGLMNAYFGAADNQIHPSLWAEIQITGWLYDGGVLMWILYGGAIIAALIFSLRTATRHPDLNVASLAKIVFVLQLALAGSCIGGPTFNTPGGTIFWILASALYGAARVYPVVSQRPAQTRVFSRYTSAVKPQ